MEPDKAMKRILACLAIILCTDLLPAQAEEEKKAAPEKAAPKMADLEGNWILGGPQSGKVLLLEIKDGKITGSKVTLGEKGELKDKTLAFKAKIKSIAAGVIELEPEGKQPESDWKIFPAPYEFEFIKEEGQVFLWLDLLRRPDLKQAGWLFYNYDKWKKAQTPD